MMCSMSATPLEPCVRAYVSALANVGGSTNP